jgi:hypothetical protein
MDVSVDQPGVTARPLRSTRRVGRSGQLEHFSVGADCDDPLPAHRDGLATRSAESTVMILP